MRHRCLKSRPSRWMREFHGRILSPCPHSADVSIHLAWRLHPTISNENRGRSHIISHLEVLGMEVFSQEHRKGDSRTLFPTPPEHGNHGKMMEKWKRGQSHILPYPKVLGMKVYFVHARRLIDATLQGRTGPLQALSPVRVYLPHAHANSVPRAVPAPAQTPPCPTATLARSPAVTDAPVPNRD